MKKNSYVRIDGILKGSMESDGEIYVYGIQTAAMLLVNFISLMVIGAFMGMVTESILFIVSFMLLRSYTGGWHINHYAGCYIISCLSIISAMLLCKIKVFQYITADVILWITAGVLIYEYSPMEHVNRPLNKKERVLFRRRSMCVFLIEVIVGIVFLVFHIEYYGISAAVYINACAMYGELIRRHRKAHRGVDC